jgi:lysophospholipase
MAPEFLVPALAAEARPKPRLVPESASAAVAGVCGLSDPYDCIGTLRTAEGAVLRYGIAHPGVHARGSVLLLQGRAECLEKYAEIVQGLVARDLNVYTFDWHGQGLSDRPARNGRRPLVRSFDDYLEDLDLFVREVWQRAKPRHYLVAHSTGGHVALRRMAERGFRMDGAVLCAPMIELDTHPWPRWFAEWLARSAVALGLGECQAPGEAGRLPKVRRFEGNQLTSDPRRFRILPDLVRAHPAFERPGVTYRWLDAAFRSIPALLRPGAAEAIAAPIACLVGSDDRLVQAEALRAFAARLPLGRVVKLKGARHEIMMENDGVLAEFWREVEEMVERGEGVAG